jgi:hypothetical protein
MVVELPVRQAEVKHPETWGDDLWVAEAPFSAEAFQADQRSYVLADYPNGLIRLGSEILVLLIA